MFRQAFDDPLIIMHHPQFFNDGCLSHHPNIPQLFTSSLHIYIIIGSPDLIDKPSGATLKPEWWVIANTCTLLLEPEFISICHVIESNQLQFGEQSASQHSVQHRNMVTIQCFISTLGTKIDVTVSRV